MRGSYILILNLKKDVKIKIGKLGSIYFPRGYYSYVGSAMGRSVNLENRLKRHFKEEKKKRWHIDYLLSNRFTSIEGVMIIPSRKKLECSISRSIETQADFTVKNFGSSDCNCKGHLHYFKNMKKLLSMLNSL